MTTDSRIGRSSYTMRQVTAVPDSSRREIPTAAVVADAIVAALVALGVLVVIFGPLETYIAGSRWSMSRPSRAFFLAAIVAAVRHWFVRHHPRIKALIV